jgi:hypothetical protein
VRRAARRDGNEKEIRAALLGQGFETTAVSSPGHPDLLVYRRGVAWLRLMEVKAVGGSITKAQKDFRENYSGPPILTVTGPQDAVRQAWDSFRGQGRTAFEDMDLERAR